MTPEEWAEGRGYPQGTTPESARLADQADRAAIDKTIDRQGWAPLTEDEIRAIAREVDGLQDGAP